MLVHFFSIYLRGKYVSPAFVRSIRFALVENDLFDSRLYRKLRFSSCLEFDDILVFFLFNWKHIWYVCTKGIFYIFSKFNLEIVKKIWRVVTHREQHFFKMNFNRMKRPATVLPYRHGRRDRSENSRFRCIAALHPVEAR